MQMYIAGSKSEIAELRWHQDAKRAELSMLWIGGQPVIGARGVLALRLAERPVVAQVGGVGDCRVKAQQFRVGVDRIADRPVAVGEAVEIDEVAIDDVRLEIAGRQLRCRGEIGRASCRERVCQYV